jgi:hypothetical protein
MIARLADRVRKQVSVHVVATNHSVVEVEPVIWAGSHTTKRVRKRVADKRLNNPTGLAAIPTKPRENREREERGRMRIQEVVAHIARGPLKTTLPPTSARPDLA